MTNYVHGYGTPEQERLVEQAEHWRHRLIRDGTELEPGTRLLEAESMMEVVIPSEARDLQLASGQASRGICVRLSSRAQRGNCTWLQQVRIVGSCDTFC